MKNGAKQRRARRHRAIIEIATAMLRKRMRAALSEGPRTAEEMPWIWNGPAVEVEFGFEVPNIKANAPQSLTFGMLVDDVAEINRREEALRRPKTDETQS